MLGVDHRPGTELEAVRHEARAAVPPAPATDLDPDLDVIAPVVGALPDEREALPPAGHALGRGRGEDAMVVPVVAPRAGGGREGSGDQSDCGRDAPGASSSLRPRGARHRAYPGSSMTRQTAAYSPHARRRAACAGGGREKRAPAGSVRSRAGS